MVDRENLFSVTATEEGYGLPGGERRSRRPSPVHGSNPAQQSANQELSEKGESFTNVMLPTAEILIRVFDFGLSMCENRKTKLSQIKNLLNSKEDMQQGVETFQEKVDEYYKQVMEVKSIWDDLVEKFDFFETGIENEMVKVRKLEKKLKRRMVAQKTYNEILQESLAVCREAGVLCLMDKLAMGEFQREIEVWKSNFSLFSSNKKKNLDFIKGFLQLHEEMEKVCKEGRDRANNFLRACQEENLNPDKREASYICRTLPVLSQFMNTPSEIGQAPQQDALTSQSSSPTRRQDRYGRSFGDYYGDYESPATDPGSSPWTVQSQIPTRSPQSPRVAFTVGNNGPLLTPWNRVPVAFAGVNTAPRKTHSTIQPQGPNTLSQGPIDKGTDNARAPSPWPTQRSGSPQTPRVRHDVRSVQSQPCVADPTFPVAYDSSTGRSTLSTGPLSPTPTQSANTARPSQSRFIFAGMGTEPAQSSVNQPPNSTIGLPHQNSLDVDGGSGSPPTPKTLHPTSPTTSSKTFSAAFAGVGIEPVLSHQNTPPSQPSWSTQGPRTDPTRINTGWTAPWTANVGNSPTLPAIYEARTVPSQVKVKSPMTSTVSTSNNSRIPLSGGPVRSRQDINFFKNFPDIGNRLEDVLNKYHQIQNKAHSEIETVQIRRGNMDESFQAMKSLKRL